MSLFRGGQQALRDGLFLGRLCEGIGQEELVVDLFPRHSEK